MQSRLFEAVEALDQPSMDGVNTFFVSWAARQAGLKVALSGLGGDELFGGYPSFRATPRLAKLLAIARRLPNARASSRIARRCWRLAVAEPIRGAPIACAKSPRFSAIPKRSRTRILFHAYALYAGANQSIAAAVDRQHVRANGPAGSAASWRRSARGIGSPSRNVTGPIHCFLSGAAHVYAEHAFARYRFGEHASFAGSSCPFARSSHWWNSSRLCRTAPRKRATPKALLAEAVGDLVAGRGREPAEAHFYVSLGALAARAAWAQKWPLG